MSGFFHVSRSKDRHFGSAEWDEEKHPRDGGKFAPKEGSDPSDGGGEAPAKVDDSVVCTKKPNDCATTAVSRVAGIPYDDAEKLIRTNGGKEGELAKLTTLIAASEDAGMKWDVDPAPGKTLAELADELTTGRHAIATEDHVATIVDGRVQNMSGHWEDDAVLVLTFEKASRDRTGGSVDPDKPTPANPRKEKPA